MLNTQQQTIDGRLYKALHKIAYEPFGDAEASDKEILDAVTELARATVKHVGDPALEPLPMLLWCPECGDRHVDVGEFATKVHHTHACQNCGMVWRPAVGPTVGVQWLPGFKDRGL